MGFKGRKKYLPAGSSVAEVLAYHVMGNNDIPVTLEASHARALACLMETPAIEIVVEDLDILVEQELRATLRDYDDDPAQLPKHEVRSIRDRLVVAAEQLLHQRGLGNLIACSN